MTTTLVDVAAALREARRSVFRLEARQDYPDDPQWQAFRAGRRWQDNDDLAAWCDLVRANRARGVEMRRARVVEYPWSPYVCFEVWQHFSHNLAAGESIGLVHAERPWAAADFWLVDDRRAFVFGPDGVHEESGPGRLARMRRHRDRALRECEWLDDAPVPLLG